MDNEHVPVVGRVRDFLSKFDSDEDNNQIKKGGSSNPSTPNAKRKVVSTLIGQLEKSSSEPSVDNPVDEKIKVAKSDNRISSEQEPTTEQTKELRGSDDEDNELKELQTQISNLKPSKLKLGVEMIPDHDGSEDIRKDGEGLIMPRKPANPCLDSDDHKSLHRELMFNKKVGKNVLNQKSELQRAMEKHRDQAARKEAEKEKLNNKTAFEKVIEERARRLESHEKEEEAEHNGQNAKPEFLQVHAKLRARMEPNK
ncbi:ensconsin [Neocloeon triangulifer]|uniref:ensconsin n=1 Tax=Neocloeon triangulifer TaxID=2078957 RepID=UPI00286EF65E|nr:ensconsin [Neocloeon triangulifer]